MRAAELARAALDRCRPDQGLEEQDHEQAGIARLVVSAEIAEGRSWNRDLSPRGVAGVSCKAAGCAEPRGVFRGECGFRSARRSRSLADRCGPLGPDDCFSRALLGPGPW